jgi:uroporphyrin-III C-methyltransferase/precorrin-2 dehydrogenase/sirohydrochlorin ferrochelatase
MPLMRAMFRDHSGKRRYLPISYDVAGKRVAVAGNGMSALAKLDLLLQTQAHLTLFAPAPRLDLAASATAAGIERIPAFPEAADLAGMTLLFLATEDEEEDRRLSAIARSLGIPVNVVDRPHLTSFAMPAIVERGPVTVAIASDGAAPVLAQRVRGLIEALLPTTLANLGDLARSIRATVLDRLPGNTSRRRFWWRTFDGEAGTAALSGDLDHARALALQDLEAAVTEHSKGKVFFITVEKEADLMTLRAQRLLLCTDVIVYGDSVSAEVLAMGRKDAGREPAGANAPALLIRLARNGRHVVRLNPLPEEGEALRRAGIDHEIVPSVAATEPVPATSIAA